MKQLHFDNHTLTRPDPEVIAAMLPFLNEKWGLPNLPNRSGQELVSILKEVYESFYTALGATGEEKFILTSSGAEAINQVIFSTYLDVSRKTGKNHFVTTELDEAPTILAQNRLEELGCSFTMAKADKKGVIHADAVLEAMTARTALVSMSSACALFGTVHSYEKIASLCKERNILFHLDITHTLLGSDHGLDADFLTFSGDLIHGPRGSGGLFIKEGVELSPLILGGNDQGGYRAGHLNVPHLVGLAEALHALLAYRDHFGTETARLRALLERLVCDQIEGAAVLFNQQERLPHVSCMTFSKVSNEALVYLLSKNGVNASFGGGNFQQISHLLTACGFESITSLEGLSFALSRETTEEMVVAGAKKIIDCVQHLQRCSAKLPKECLR